MHPNIACWLTKAIHNPAEGCLVDAQHSCQTVLPDACGVHPQLQVRINVSIQGHGFALVFYRFAASCGDQNKLLLRHCFAISVPNAKRLICQHIVAMRPSGKSQKISILPGVFKVMRNVIWRVAKLSKSKPRIGYSD